MGPRVALGPTLVRQAGHALPADPAEVGGRLRTQVVETVVQAGDVRLLEAHLVLDQRDRLGRRPGFCLLGGSTDVDLLLASGSGCAGWGSEDAGEHSLPVGLLLAHRGEARG